jgi:predicted naringenin-chalcone synthase
MATGYLALPQALKPSNDEARVDIVHTELCSLHLDPSNHSAEQCVVQSLFADGFIRYSLIDSSQAVGLELLSASENILPDSAGAMGWVVGDHGMQMTLTREVPERIAAVLRPFVIDLFAKAGLRAELELSRCVAAIHPGGPKIIEQARQVLELEQRQVQTSCDVLREFGNMSSATLPHVWQRICDDPAVKPGVLVLSLAFGPGLSICGALLRKHAAGL